MVLEPTSDIIAFFAYETFIQLNPKTIIYEVYPGIFVQMVSSLPSTLSPTIESVVIRLTVSGQSACARNYCSRIRCFISPHSAKWPADHSRVSA